MKFSKYEAAGNDFVVIDARKQPELLSNCIADARQICDRHYGIGADGILVIAQSLENPHADDVDAAMHVINSDGSIAAMCGNGIRCVADYLFRAPDVPLRIDTLGGLQIVQCTNANLPRIFQVRMSKAQLTMPCCLDQSGHIWHGQCVDVGNPHAVFEIEDSPSDALKTAGEFLSNHPFFPDRCNIEFIRPIAAQTLELTVYERGAGPTLACGTGCVAAAVAFADHHDLSNTTIEIHAPGGILHVIISGRDVRLQGQARRVFEGIWA